MRRIRKYLGSAFILLTLAGCGEGTRSSPATPSLSNEPLSPSAVADAGITVLLLDFRLNVSAEGARSGESTFAVRNSGEIPHELVIVATDLDADELPLDDARVNESQLDVVARSSILAPGETEELTVDLAPGHYVLICNLSGHYDFPNDVGMRTNFDVI
jgi:uncharacterized cupredoxin-like copper-binding protein